MTTSIICERFAATSASPRVDTTRGIVYGVRVVGQRSRNGRFYPEQVLRRAVPLYNNVGVYVGHGQDQYGRPIERSPADKFGRLANPRYDRDGIHADLHFNPVHPFAESFAWAVQHDPDLYAFSHLAAVRWQPQTDQYGNKVAEAIVEVASVDIVSEGGATRGVFESARSTPELVAESYESRQLRELHDRLVLSTDSPAIPLPQPRKKVSASELADGFTIERSSYVGS